MEPKTIIMSRRTGDDKMLHLRSDGSITGSRLGGAIRYCEGRARHRESDITAGRLLLGDAELWDRDVLVAGLAELRNLTANAAAAGRLPPMPGEVRTLLGQVEDAQSLRRWMVANGVAR